MFKPFAEPGHKCKDARRITSEHTRPLPACPCENVIHGPRLFPRPALVPLWVPVRAQEGRGINKKPPPARPIVVEASTHVNLSTYVRCHYTQHTVTVTGIDKGLRPVSERQVIHMASSIAALLDKAKLVHNLSSDYKLALVMGVSHVSLLSYRSGKTLPDARVIALLCELTGDDPAMLAAEIEAQRAKTPEARALWLSVVSRLRETAVQTVSTGVFAALALGLLGSGVPSSQAHANTVYGAQNSENVYYVKLPRCPDFNLSSRCHFHRLRWDYPTPRAPNAKRRPTMASPLYLRGSLL